MGITLLEPIGVTQLLVQHLLLLMYLQVNLYLVVVDGTTVNDGQLKTAYEKFNDADTVDVGLIIAGPSGSSTHVDNLITIAENRKDVVVFASPQRSDVVNVSDSNTQTSNVVDFFSNVRSSSYVVFDSGYKYTYDRYNDVYRYYPLNGDISVDYLQEQTY